MISDRNEDSLSIQFKYHPGQLMMTLSGSAENNNAGFIQSALEEATSFCEYRRANSIAIDMRQLAFCYSSCVKVFTNWMTGYSRPDKIDLYLGTQAWQVTSMKMLARMSRDCNVIENCTCSHANTRTDEEDFYAPTGNGSTVYSTFCNDCGVLIHKYSVYND